MTLQDAIDTLEENGYCSLHLQKRKAEYHGEDPVCSKCEDRRSWDIREAIEMLETHYGKP